MNQLMIESIHGDCYRDFWNKRFPDLYKDFLEALLREQNDDLAFKASIQVQEVQAVDVFSRVDATGYCMDRGLDLTQNLFLKVRISDYGAVHSLHLGRIPMQTPDGSFILNGKERFPIAQLVKSPGLMFNHKNITRKHMCEGKYYDVRWLIFSAALVPSVGIWLEFELMKLEDPDEQLKLLPEELQAILKDKDQQIRVKILRKHWFSVEELLFALGIHDVALPEPNDVDEEDWGLPVEAVEEHYARTKLQWREIAHCLDIPTGHESEEKIKVRIQEKLLKENHLSALGRLQIDRRLNRLNGYNPPPIAARGHLNGTDILGILQYLQAIAEGGNLPLDSRRSLANKRVRRIGDLMEEEILPTVFWRIRQAMKKRVEKAARPGKRIQEDQWTQIFQETLSGDLLLNKIKQFLFEKQLSALASRQNTLERMSLLRRITLFGPKGLPNVHVKDVRDIHWSHYGRLCPVDTPQSNRLGATLSIPLEARVNPLGLIEIPVHEVGQSRGNPVVKTSIRWLSAADEENEACWIGYYDQIEELEAGKRIRARKGAEEFQEVNAHQVNYVDAGPLQQFSLAPRLIPFLQHDDANRVLMSCSAMRQALPLAEKEPPWITTGYEAALADDKGNPWTYGRNLLVAYMPFRGLNFEDAVVVSESAARKLGSVQRYEYEIKLKEYVSYVETRVQGKTHNKPKPVVKKWEIISKPLRSAYRRRHLGSDGIVQIGAWVEPGEILIGVEDPYQRARTSAKALAIRSQEARRIDPWDHSLVVPAGESGRVTDVRIFSRENGGQLPSGVWQLVRVTVERPLPLEVGDKLTNRHGGKGVVSAIFKDEAMPWLMDPMSGHDHDGIGPHTHVEMIMNPLGVISRLNLGQLYETHLGWIAKRTNRQHLTVKPFTDSLTFLREENGKMENNPAKDGKVFLYDPVAGKEIERPVTVGYAYILRLHHLAEEKVHGRGYARFKYSALSEQPLQGKKNRGGQRLGEMEIWALEAYDARHIIQEVLTLKSDNPFMREWLYQAQKEQASIKGAKPEPPEMLRVLARFLMAMGLRLDFLNPDGNPLTPTDLKGIGSPNKIHGVAIRPLAESETESIACGEVTEAEIGTEAEGYNDNGLFSQPIFGPLVDRVCKCGTIYPLGARTPARCKKCEVEIAKRDIRRRRMGFIQLVRPVFNVVFLDVACRLLGISRSRMKDMLKETAKSPILRFQKPLDFDLFFWLAMNGSDEFKGRITTLLDHPFPEDQSGFHQLKELLDRNRWRNRLGRMSSEELLEGFSAIEMLGKMLKALTPERLREMRKNLLEELTESKDKGKDEARQNQLLHRLEVITLFLQSGVLPSDMMIRTLPVLPPDLRKPYVRPGGSEAFGELNELYRGVIFANCAMKGEKGKGKASREPIRRLQQRVSALIDNSRADPPSIKTDTGIRYQQSLAYFIQGKKGFFRANLLGKRVDYSGRAVIVPDPSLHVNQCGLPYRMAVEIFMPVLIQELRDRWRPRGRSGENRFLSDRTIEARIKRTFKPSLVSSTPGVTVCTDNTDQKEVQDLLNQIGQNHPILLNRQPTLHRLGIQAFHFKINHHNAVSMHPMVTAGFNADFDGDTIAVHRLVTREALDESQRLMAGNNLFSPASGEVTLNLGQDVALGAYLKTMTEAGMQEFQQHAGFKVETDPLDRKAFGAYLKTLLQYDRVTDPSQGAAILDDLKNLCFESATDAGITLSIFDMPDLSRERDSLRAEAKATDKINLEVEARLNADTASALSLIYRSGAKGDIRTIRQLVAMRGMMERIADGEGVAAGSIVWSSLREGMSQGEYFVSAYGSRTTLVDKKMGTAEAGYVTRQLVEMTQRYRISRQDCAAPGDVPPQGMGIGPFRYDWLDVKDYGEEALVEKLYKEGSHVSQLLWDIHNEQTDSAHRFQEMDRPMDRLVEDAIRQKNPLKRLLGVKVRERRSFEELAGKLYGRTLLTPVQLEGGSEPAGFVAEREEDALHLARQIFEEERPIRVRSPITCRCANGICQKCYGLDLSTGNPPEIGAKVGIIAAQSIGEPGTQLVLRTFHSGGVMGMAGISKDIPRVQRYLNANALAQAEAVSAGLSVDTYPLLIDGIKNIYLKNNVAVADCHFEILLKAMLSKVETGAVGLNGLFPGQILNKDAWTQDQGGGLTARPILCGIHRFSEYPTGWLAAAAFGRALTTLAYAAAGGRKDPLAGLKENVILGKLLP